MAERTTVRLPPDLLDRAKRKAAADGRTLTSLIEDGLRLVIGSERKARPSRRLPRVSRAAGGLMPGIDLERAADGQEAEDLDYIRRLQRHR